jgi:tRNA dimethylallyltransferase
MSARRRAVLIAGPTASGKSALALAKARETDAAIVNADAMQVYGVLRVLTARPSAADEGRAPHFLFGIVAPSTRYSTGEWLRDAERVVEETAANHSTLIFVGGTGLYFDALINGFADVPMVPAETTARIAAEVAALDRDGRARLIAERDPDVATRLRSPDPQRVTRALAVLEATGRSLATYQGGAQRGLLGGFDVERIVLNPSREVLRQRIAERFEAMVEGGGVPEVKALLALELDASLPAMKAIGVREIADWLAGRITREEATERAVTATRQYAKRQRTWFRSRMADWTWIDPLDGSRPRGEGEG